MRTECFMIVKGCTSLRDILNFLDCLTPEDGATAILRTSMDIYQPVRRNISEDLKSSATTLWEPQVSQTVAYSSKPYRQIGLHNRHTTCFRGTVTDFGVLLGRISCFKGSQRDCDDQNTGMGSAFRERYSSNVITQKSVSFVTSRTSAKRQHLNIHQV